LTFNPGRLRKALEAGHLCATDVADQLVTLGVPFRNAHHSVGQLVRRAEELGVQLDKLPIEEVRAVHPGLTPEHIEQMFNVEAAVERRQLLGGPARPRVLEAIQDARQRWAAARG
jgi:argininosuccinate lyase